MRNLLLFIASIISIISIIVILPVSALSVREIEIASTTQTQNILSREKMIQQTLTSPSFIEFALQKLIISIDHMLLEPRGRMKGRSITLSSSVMRDSEFLKLFVHEF